MRELPNVYSHSPIQNEFYVIRGRLRKKEERKMGEPVKSSKKREVTKKEVEGEEARGGG